MEEINMRLSDREVELGEAGEVVDKEGKFDIERYLSIVWSKHRITTIIGGLGALFLGIGILTSLVLVSRQPSEIEIIPAEKEEANQGKIFVDLSGAVQKPGVYQLDSGARVNDVLVEAGGLSAQADREWIAKNLNLAAKLKDGTKIYIRSLEQQGSFSSSQGSTEVAGISVATDLVNINTASQAELDSLPGIGPVLAQRIIDYREKNGAFAKAEDLLKVSGIGQNLFTKVKDRITIW